MSGRGGKRRKKASKASVPDSASGPSTRIDPPPTMPNFENGSPSSSTETFNGGSSSARGQHTKRPGPPLNPPKSDDDVATTNTTSSEQQSLDNPIASSMTSACSSAWSPNASATSYTASHDDFSDSSYPPSTESSKVSTPPSSPITYGDQPLVEDVTQLTVCCDLEPVIPTTFHHFIYLPSEIRIRIWNHHIMDAPGRLVQISINEETGECTSETLMPTELFGALRATRESRYEVLRQYPQRFGTDKYSASVRFNLARDTFYLNTSALPCILVKMRQCLRNELSLIRKWCIPYLMWAQFTIEPYLVYDPSEEEHKINEQAHEQFFNIVCYSELEEMHLVGHQDWLMGLRPTTPNMPFPTLPNTSTQGYTQAFGAIHAQVQAAHAQYSAVMAAHTQQLLPVNSTGDHQPRSVPARFNHHLPWGRIDVDDLALFDTKPINTYTLRGDRAKIAWNREIEKLDGLPVFLSFLGYGSTKSGLLSHLRQ